MLRTARWVTGSAWRDLVLFALVFAWMAQLLIPFGEATKIPAINPFLLFLGELFAVDFLLRHWFWRGVLKLILIGCFMYSHYYAQYQVTSPRWLLDWGVDLYFSISLALRSNFQQMPDVVYTTVFLVVLSLLQSFFRQSLRSRSWTVLFLILGSTGLGVLDTFYVSDDKGEIVLFVLIGLVILAFMQLPLIERQSRMVQRMKGWPREWLTWTLVLALIVVGISGVAPKQMNATWPDPVAYLNSKVGKGPVHQKIGYGADDSHLGGPFEMDDTPVFTVITSNEGYYRGETKTIYTGKGWLSASMGLAVPNLQDITPFEQHEQSNLETKKVVQTFQFLKDMYPVVFSEYRMTGVTGVENSFQSVRYSDFDSRLLIGQLKAGKQYVVTSQVPIYDEQKLKAANLPSPDSGFAPYTLLPSEVPQRVKDLAKRITADAKTPYERAQAVESYLRNHYSYDTQDVAVPDDNQDYVDQFLFESKKGYCDNFSTAFVVLVRSLGMPARWVKGFTKGDVDLSYQSKNKGEYKYVVKNKNAHSWPEVYFEGVGWVPFEPTASFPTIPRLMKETPDTSTIAPPVPDLGNKKKDGQDSADNSGNGGGQLAINWQALGTAAADLAGVLLILAVVFRRKLLTWYYLRRAYRGDDALAALSRLFTIMEKLGWRRPEDMTLREYAAQLSASVELRGREMIPLAKLFERVRYGRQNVSDKEKTQIRDLWTRMIRKAGRFKRK